VARGLAQQVTKAVDVLGLRLYPELTVDIKGRGTLGARQRPPSARSDQTPKGIAVDVRSGGHAYPSPPAKSMSRSAGYATEHYHQIVFPAVRQSWPSTRFRLAVMGQFAPRRGSATAKIAARGAMPSLRISLVGYRVCRRAPSGRGSTSQPQLGQIRQRIEGRGPMRSSALAPLATASWIHFWNPRRLHSACGDVPPAKVEAAYHSRLRATSEAA